MINFQENSPPLSNPACLYRLIVFNTSDILDKLFDLIALLINFSSFSYFNFVASV